MIFAELTNWDLFFARYGLLDAGIVRDSRPRSFTDAEESSWNSRSTKDFALCLFLTIKSANSLEGKVLRLSKIDGLASLVSSKRRGYYSSMSLSGKGENTW